MNIFEFNLIFVIFYLGLFYLVEFINHKKGLKEVNSGTATIVEPKYGKVGTFGFYVCSSVLLVVCLKLIGQFEAHLSTLTKNCQTFMGYDTFYFSQLSGFVTMFIVSIAYCVYSLNHYKKMKAYQDKFYPPTDTQPIFIRNVFRLVDEKKLRKEKMHLTTAVMFIPMIIFMYFILPNKPFFPTSKANEAYQQACVAELKEKSP